MISQIGEPVILKGTTSAQPAWDTVKIVNRRGDASFSRKLTVRCEDGSNGLNVSLDGGATYITITTTERERTFDGAVTKFFVQSAGAAASTAAWSAIVSVA